LTKVEGDLIAWQDADDISHPERLAKMVSAFDKDPSLMICGCNYSRTLEPWKIKLVSDFPTTYEEIMESIRTNNKLPFLGGARMMRRELLAEFPSFRPFFDRIGWEDKDYILRVAEKYKIANLPDVLYEYRYSRGSASRAFSEEKYLKLFSEEIGFFLARQRWRDGIDGLMKGGNKAELDAYLYRLKEKFDKDKSILFYWSCVNKINNKDYLFAYLDAFHAIRKNPTNPRNYLLFIRVMGSFLRFSSWFLLHYITSHGQSIK
jgi:hypothetical protein